MSEREARFNFPISLHRLKYFLKTEYYALYVGRNWIDNEKNGTEFRRRTFHFKYFVTIASRNLFFCLKQIPFGDDIGTSDKVKQLVLENLENIRWNKYKKEFIYKNVIREQKLYFFGRSLRLPSEELHVKKLFGDEFHYILTLAPVKLQKNDNQLSNYFLIL